MATLVQLSSGNIRSESGRGSNALQTLLSDLPFLSFLERNSGWELDATTFTWTPTTAASTAPARAIGANFSENTRTFPNAVTGSQRIHGDAVTTDITYLRDANAGLGNRNVQLEKDVARRLKTYGAAYEALLFNGSGSSNTIIGLKTILDGTTNLPGYSVTRVKNAKDVAASGDSLNIGDSAGQKKFLELLRTSLADVNTPTGIVINRSLWARIETAAYDRGLTAPGVNEFGQAITRFSGIELVVVNDSTIALNEPDDNNTPVTNTTSCYIMSPGEMRLSLVSNSGLAYMDWDHQDNAEKGKETWEIGAAWKIEVPESILRIRNIKL